MSTEWTQTILVVDDVPEICDLLEEVIHTAGHAVLKAFNAYEALGHLSRERVDLMITDVDMPGPSGIELLREVRKDYGIPVILLTGKPDLEAAVECMKIGAYDYLAKPCPPGKLIDVLEHALEQSRNHMMRHSIAGYEVVRTLGEGNMGIVFQVKANDEFYALKVIKNFDDRGQQRDEFLERFMREAAIMSELRHPNITRVYEYGLEREERIPYMLLEYVRGQDLMDFSDEHPQLTFHQKAHVIRQISDAIDAIHQKAVRHRDINPYNMLIDDSLHVKLLDFGVAYVPGSGITQHDVIGTPEYFAPEQFEDEADDRTDLFALGTTAYEFLVGHRPFEGEKTINLVDEIMYKKPEAPSKLIPDFPDDLELILGKLMQKKPEARYQTAKEVTEDLTRFIHDEPLAPNGLLKRLQASTRKSAFS